MLFLKTCVAHDSVCTLEKIIMAKVTGHIQPRMSHITEMFISPLPLCLWSSNLARWWLRVRDSHPLNHFTIWLCSLLRSRDKLRTLHFHYQSDYNQQSLQNEKLPSWAPTCKVTSSFDHVVLRDHKLKLSYLHYDNAYGDQT